MSKRKYLAPGFGFETGNSQMKICLGETVPKRAFDVTKKLCFAIAANQRIKRQVLLLVVVLVLVGHDR